MERRMFFAAAATAVLILQLLVALIAPSSCSSVERDDHWCGLYQSGTWALCDPGRCCGPESYCGQGYEYCSPDYCTFQCPRAPPVGYDQSNYEVTETQGAGTGGGVLTRLVNATLHNNHYFNLNIGGDELVKMTADNASSSSSSSSPPSLLSCARSLSRLPLVSRYKFPFAALPAPQAQNNITAATRCGRCLMVTNLGVGELHRQVKVRIVHGHGNEGLGLNLNTFKQLDTDGSGITKGHILVKYKFESC